jgi:putative nucleotidyltransferase with HDIG domain
VVGEDRIEDEERLAETMKRSGQRMSVRETIAETLTGAGFWLAVALIWLVQTPHQIHWLAAATCTAILAAATQVRFHTPFGYTAPIQLAFVPVLFEVPPAVVPLAVAIGFALPMLAEIRHGRVEVSRLLNVPGNCWFCIGPVAVLALTGIQARSAGVWILVAALGAQFAVDIFISAVRFAIAQGVSLVEQTSDLWVYAVDAALSGVALCVAEATGRSPAYVLVLAPLLGLFAMFASERRRRLEGMLELSSAYRGTALVLGDVVEADDGYTGEHSKSVVGLALEVADHLHLAADQRRNLEFGALLHDVGKIAIPKHIINKPGKLDAKEWLTIKTHTLEGQKMLERVGGFMREVGLIVRSHHERWEGAGYPDGLRGEEIPLEARIVSCCDTWNAMRTDRSYRKALSYEVAVSEMRAAAGSQLDPRVVEALLEVVTEPEPAAIEPVIPTSSVPPKPLFA